ncbi:hypothetical protein L9F63_003473 [Diploptera punctata]|uniref:CBF1-interacting co-repressor CIR N-terminal domain-containing protein n=1 Tax=Diploptera punctata TaxID=6984 RepID=A0AAD7ZKP8_DIPPU|nr:hypothetical protein L9F63_003473 [Diploptera punctata]
MNILPKKSWHVRTKENIARVRRDEAKAAEEEKEREKRAQIAEGEARNTLLREKARQRVGEVVVKSTKKEEPQQQKHINFFEDLEEGKIVSNATNADHELEKKEEREKYEKQIGYLTYLGQDTVESTGRISWRTFSPHKEHAIVSHEHPIVISLFVPERGLSVDDTESRKILLGDPLKDIRRYLGSKEPQSESKNKKIDYEKERKRKKGGSDNSEDGGEMDRAASAVKLENLRVERLKREEAERKRAEAVLAKLRGDPVPEEKKSEPIITQRYHSQFNPHLARQNKP